MKSTPCFSRNDAKHFYNRFGAKQDRQGFYEDAALDSLVEYGDFSNASSVMELGCGTGRFAARLLATDLPSTARYVGIDISETMVGLAKEKLKPWAERSEVHLSGGELEFSTYGKSFERWVCTYVFDLLSHRDIEAALLGAHATLRKGGLLCAASLTNGTGILSSVTSKLWTFVHDIRPSLVGGCRPLALANYMPQIHWQILHREVVVSSTVASEILVAKAI